MTRSQGGCLESRATDVALCYDLEAPVAYALAPIEAHAQQVLVVDALEVAVPYPVAWACLWGCGGAWGKLRGHRACLRQ